MTPKRTVKDYFHKRKQKDFILGENEPDYKTKYNIEYYDKSSIPQPNDLYEIQKRMRKDQTILGSDKPELITEHTAEYIPKEHQDLIGYQTVDWDTTYRQKYTPKKNENDPNQKLNIQRSNILLGDGKFQNKTKYAEDYINYQIKNTPQNLNYITERRKNNFDIAQNNIFEGESVTKKDYSNPYNNPNYIPNQSQIIKKSNFSIGDKNLEGIYETTYQTQMTPKRTIVNYNMIKKNQKDSFDSNLKGEYITNYQENYIQKDLNNNKYDLKNLKDSQFNFGNSKLDYKSVMMNDYSYNEQKAREARNQIDNNFMNKLKKGEYDINEGPFYDKTTYKHYYLPFDQLNQLEKERQEKLFSRGYNYHMRGKFEGETMYSTDYVKKPLTNVYHYIFK